jgi:hypothetical protein
VAVVYTLVYGIVLVKVWATPKNTINPASNNSTQRK